MMALPSEPAGARRAGSSLRHPSTPTTFSVPLSAVYDARFKSVPAWPRTPGPRDSDREGIARQRRFRAADSGREWEGGERGAMATIDDDSLTLSRRLLTGFPIASAEPAWVRACAIELLRSLDKFQVPTAGKQRLLLRLRHRSSRRTFAWLLPVVVGSLLIGIGGGIAIATLTDWPTWVVRPCRTLLSAPFHAARLSPKPPAVSAHSVRRPEARILASSQ